MITFRITGKTTIFPVILIPGLVTDINPSALINQPGDYSYFDKFENPFNPVKRVRIK